MSLVLALNTLLATLALPFTLDDPTDLTPSLLLAIFESLINARLPIPLAIRQSRTKDAQARAMLVLLGVLECDILRGGTDVHPDNSSIDDSALAGAGGVSVDGWVDEIGLGEVDPERLADGGREETIFIGELLCWLARRKGILPRNKYSSHTRSLYSNYHSYGDEGDSADVSTSLLLRPSPRPSPSIPDSDHEFYALSHITDVPRHPLVHSPDPSFSASVTDLSIHAKSVSSRTTVSNPHDDPHLLDEVSHDTTHDPRQMMQDAEDNDDLPPTFRPCCIHELEDSYIRPSQEHISQYDDTDDPSRDHDDPYAPPTPTPTPRRVRLTGWIEPVDATAELNHFATSRARALSRSSASSSLPSHAYFRPPRHVSPSSPSPSPPRPTASSRHPTRTPPSPLFSPSPSPSPPHSDPPFDISFSTFNNTSTPAKPRPRVSRRPFPQSQSQSQMSVGAGTGTGTRHRDRSPSCAPSPPSFLAPGGLRQPGSTRPSTSGPSTGKIPTPPGSTTVTSTLLTERARLLTELAALKRARVASGGGSGNTGGISTTGTGTRGSVGRRVGIGA